MTASRQSVRRTPIPRRKNRTPIRLFLHFVCLGGHPFPLRAALLSAVPLFRTVVKNVIAVLRPWAERRERQVAGGITAQNRVERPEIMMNGARVWFGLCPSTSSAGRRHVISPAPPTKQECPSCFPQKADTYLGILE